MDVHPSIDILRAWWPHLTAGFVFLVDFTAASHVVLYKKDPRSAVGWIGIILVLPFVGAILYVTLGINRIQRRASRLRLTSRLPARTPPNLVCPPEDLASRLPPDARHLAAVARVSHRSTRRPLLLGNRIEPLLNGDTAYPAMLDAIRAARRSITLATYIFDNDEAGALFVKALAEAVQRGVEVRVLVDYVGSRYSFPPATLRLRRAGVPAALFLKTVRPWRTPYMNLRNHRKLLVIDGQTAFTGGMNIRAGHLLALQSRDPVQDLHFRVTGPVVRQIQECFVEDWSFATGEALKEDRWYADERAAGVTLARGIADGPDEEHDRIRRVILGALSAAQRRVRIATPYFLPDLTLISALNVCAMRDVSVEILIPARNNLRMVQWACQAQLWQVLQRGCRVWLTRPPFDHTKIMTVDDTWSLIGSANWDARSLRLNFEFNIECFDSALAAELNLILDEKQNNAREVTLSELDGRSLPVRFRDGIARLFTPYL